MAAAHAADERQPLLASSSSTSLSSSQQADEDDLKVDGTVVERSSHALIRQEIGYLLRQSPPLVLGFCLESLVSLIVRPPFVPPSSLCSFGPALLPARALSLAFELTPTCFRLPPRRSPSPVGSVRSSLPSSARAS